MHSDTIKFTVNEADNQFTVHTEGRKGTIGYDKPAPDHVKMYHTEVDPELAGKGVAQVLVQRALEYCKANNWKVTPTCTYVAAYIKKHPEFEELVKI